MSILHHGLRFPNFSTSSDHAASAMNPSTSRPQAPIAISSVLKINRKRQEGNPVLKYIRSIPYEFADIKPDFECGIGVAVNYLSLQWHKSHQNYIETRFSDANNYLVKILLVLVNVENPASLLRDLNMYCYRSKWTLILCYSVEEAAEYIESLKLAEKRKPEDVMQGREKWKQSKQAAYSKPGKKDEEFKQLQESAIKFLTAIRAVSNTDAKKLLAHFGSLKNIAQAGKDDLEVCPGLGPIKAENVWTFFRTPMRIG
uniref:HHH_2 domain-containing protein n=1 Tax=Panagrellus redivivus TaxID=6233 RepID=A0A7E4WBK7_PANRE